MNAIDDLDGVLRDITQRLYDGATSRHSAMHMPVIGTADGDLRMMVLRGCDPELSNLRFHTDARSPKAADVGRGAPLGMLAFDPEAKVQIRARGIGRIEHDSAAADAAWAASDAYARRCYLAELPPGTAMPQATSGLPSAVEGIRPDEAQLRPGRSNFAILLLTLTSLDWFSLAHSGHRRARFERGGAGEPWQGTWIVP